MEKESPYFSAILLCQQILKAEGKNKLTSLMNIFDNMVISIDASDLTTIPIPIECYLFAKLTDKEPRDKYLLTIQIFSPSGKKLQKITGELQNKSIDNPGSVGDIIQPLNFKTDEDGDHLVNIRFQDQIIGQTTLHVSRGSTPEP